MTFHSAADANDMLFADVLPRMRWVTLYVGMALFTLGFQIWWRSFQCAGECGLSYAKAVVWPASWTVFLAGIFGIS